MKHQYSSNLFLLVYSLFSFVFINCSENKEKSSQSEENLETIIKKTIDTLDRNKVRDSIYKALLEEDSVMDYLTCDAGRRRALKDHSMKQLGYFLFGLRISHTYGDLLRDKYGIKIYSRGCEVNEGYTCYNSYMESLIIKKYGPGFFASVAQKADIIDHGIRTSAEFPGGNEALEKYLSENFSYTNETDSVVGEVMVSFTVDTLGFVVDPRILWGLTEEINEECLRVVKNFPLFIPAIKDGQRVKQVVRLPISIE